MSMRIASDSLNEAPEQQHVMPGARERREYRRHDLEHRQIAVDRFDGNRSLRAVPLGYIVDLSAGGVRLRTTSAVRCDHQVRVRIELPPFAGICPFVDTAGGQPRPKRDWIGWMTVTRCTPVDGGRAFDVAGRLVDMEDLDRGMLGLYLSTQPLAA